MTIDWPRRQHSVLDAQDGFRGAGLVLGDVHQDLGPEEEWPNPADSGFRLLASLNELSQKAC